MAIENLDSGASSAGGESFSFLVDYDTVAQTIGLTCTGNGHAGLTVVQTSNQNELGTVNCDQYGTTTGTIRQTQTFVNGLPQGDAGQSDGPVTYTGQRVVVLGPGATGISSTGSALSTAKVPASVVGTFQVPKGQTPGLSITLSWDPLP